MGQKITHFKVNLFLKQNFKMTSPGLNPGSTLHFNSFEREAIAEARKKAASQTERVSHKYESFSWEKCERCNKDYEPKIGMIDYGLCKSCR